MGVECGVVDAKLFGESSFDFGFEGGFGGCVQCDSRGLPTVRQRRRSGRDDGLGGGGEFGVAGEGSVGVAGCFGSLEGHEAVALAGDDEFGVVDEAHAVLGGEALGTGSDEVDVGGFFEDDAGGLDGVAETFDAGYASGAEVGAAHEEGVELDAAVAGEEGASAGVEGVVVFHDGDGGFYGVDGGATSGESGPAGGEGGGDASFVGGYGVVGHGPGSAVDEQDGLVCEGVEGGAHTFPVYGRAKGVMRSTATQFTVNR